MERMLSSSNALNSGLRITCSNKSMTTDSIPLYEISEDIRLLVLAREFPTGSGPKENT